MIKTSMRPLPWLGRKWTPLNFTNPNFIRLSTTQAIEEESIPGYVAGRYYPTRIGEVLQDRYQVLGKLGFGASSTVWLARDMDYRRYVTLKIFVRSTSMGQQLDDELNIYKRFDINGPEDKHRCLVHLPLWESVLDFLHRNLVRRLPPAILAVTLHRLFLALDYLHTECKVIHTDIKADNLMFRIDNDSVFHDFEENELRHPSPRKELVGRTIYTSREPKMSKDIGAPVLCDFGSAVLGDEAHSEDIQPNIYRAPEVILQVPWTYSVDIWNAGCVIWNLFEGGGLFSGQDPEFKTYRSRAHLAEMIRLLGPPPKGLLRRGSLTSKFFSEEADFSAEVPVGEHTPLEQRETSLEGKDKEKFLCLVRKMLQWEPEKRSSAKELEQDQWIQGELHK